MAGTEPAPGATRPLVMAVPEEPDHTSWLTREECEEAGIGLVWAAIERHAGGTGLPDVSALDRTLRSLAPDACLLLSDGPASRLVRVVADLASLPVFTLVTSAEQLDNLPRRTKIRPDLFFIADPDQLPAALNDGRYGATLLATGHPARDLSPAGPSAADARRRLLAAIQRWWNGELARAAPDLSIVIPAYREAGNLPTVCTRLIETLDRDRVDAEILIVDDSSPDDTYAVALAQMWRSPRIRPLTKGPPRGMGHTIRHGISRARAPVVAITMGDGSDDVARIPAMFRKVRDEDYGLAIGSRYRQRANYEAVPKLYRFWSMIFRYTTWTLIGVRLRDYTNAFRVFRLSAVQPHGLEGGGFEISPEITFKAWFATRRIAEVDVKHLKRGTGQSSFSFLRAGPGYGMMLIKALICRITGRWFVLDW